MHFFVGTKNTPMPPNFYKSEVKSLKLLCEEIIQSRLSLEKYFTFLKKKFTNRKVPHFHGFNRATREYGQSTKPKAKLIYAPLIDQTPSDLSTMMTAMIELEKPTNEAGQAYTIFTADQQLYCVILGIIWTNPQRFSKFIHWISGIHRVMSFIGSLGVLMENSGLQKMMKSVFAGTEKMLTVKLFPMNVRALRFTVVKLLRGFVDDMVCRED